MNRLLTFNDDISNLIAGVPKVNFDATGKNLVLTIPIKSDPEDVTYKGFAKANVIEILSNLYSSDLIVNLLPQGDIEKSDIAKLDISFKVNIKVPNSGVGAVKDETQEKKH